MIRVRNRGIIRKLAYRDFDRSKARNIIAITAIALTTLLFTSLFTMGSGMMKSMQGADMIMSGGDGHAEINYLSDLDYSTISAHSLIKEIAYCRKLADSVNNTSLIKRQTEFWYYDDVGLEFKFIELAGGHKPKEVDEVIVDTATLELLGIPQKQGSPLTLELTVHGKDVTRNFVLAGWWESYPGLPLGTIVASRAYVDAHLGELQNTYYQNQSETGIITGILKFEDVKNIANNLKTVVAESGFSMDINSSNHINTGVNPFYQSIRTTSGSGTIFALACALLLFVFTGYLIIYNIFQISILRDIRYYGLLKTIGTTGHQLRTIMRKQAWILSLIGIPPGLFGGFFVGKALVPVLMAQSSITGNVLDVSPNPIIFLVAAVFSLITVFISIRKPEKMVAKISPVEAVRYADANATVGKKKTKKSFNGGTPNRMAWANLGRNKKRTVLVVLSLSLSVVLTNTVFTFTQSIDADNALKSTMDSDFRIGHLDLFNYRYTGSEESAISESFIAAVEEQDGIEAGGRQYGRSTTYISETTRQSYNQRQDGSFSTNLYGLDEYSFSRLKVVDGEVDAEKLATGKYILEGVWTDTRGNMDTDSMNHEVGEKVKLGFGGNIREVVVLGHVIANETNTYDWVGSCFFLPGDIYKELTGDNYAMSYVFDVEDDKETDIEHYLKWYTDKVEPTMNYKSKFTVIAGLTDIRNTIITIGGTLSLIIGIIGILNFINSILTSILTRRKEFAVLQSIGMTRRQLMTMLRLEGCYYAALTAVSSILLSIGSSLFIVRPLCEQIWFFSFNFNFWPLVIILPLLFVLGALMPNIMYYTTKKQSIVERLRIDG